MKALLIVTPILDALTGLSLSLLVVPYLTISMLLGAEIGEAAGLVTARIVGAAIVALAVACWQPRGREGGGAAIGVVAAMLFINAAATSILVSSGIRLGLQSSLMWPAICCMLRWRCGVF